MSTITGEEPEYRMQNAVEKALKKRARLAEADTLRRIDDYSAHSG